MEWLAGGGLLTLIGLSLFLWLRSIGDDRFRGEMRQALLGYEGRGGIMSDLESVKQELKDLRDRIASNHEALRNEIKDSRHFLREELEEKINTSAARLDNRVDELAKRIRDLEVMRSTR